MIFVLQSSAPVLQEQQYAPIPYQFAYKAESAESTHGHSETSDGNGNAQGEFYLKLADGRARNVRYSADGNGFVAEIETNELGTESKDTADAKYTSTAITAYEAALQYGAAEPRTQTQVIQAPAPIVRVKASAPTIVKTVQASPVIRTVQASPVIRTIQAAPIFKTYSSAAAPTIIKTIRSNPVAYAVAQHEPITYAYAQGAHYAIEQH